MGDINDNNQEDPQLNNTSIPTGDRPPDFGDDSLVSAIQHAVYILESRNITNSASNSSGPPSSVEKSSASPSSSSSSSTPASINATLIQMSWRGNNQQSTRPSNQQPRNRRSAAELNAEAQMIRTGCSKTGPPNTSGHSSRQPQLHTSAALPQSAVDQQQNYRLHLAQRPTQPSSHPSRQPQISASAVLPPFSKDQYGNNIYVGFEWAKIKPFEEVMEDIEKNPMFKVEGRELTKEEQLWNKAVLHSIEKKDIYFDEHLAGKHPNCDEFLFPNSLFNPLGEYGVPQVVAKPPGLFDVWKRAQKLVGADKLPWNSETKKRCENWVEMLRREHKIQIAMGFIVPRQMRAAKRRQMGSGMGDDEDLDDDEDDVEPPRKIAKMMDGNDDNDNSGRKNTSNNNGCDEEYDLD